MTLSHMNGGGGQRGEPGTAAKGAKGKGEVTKVSGLHGEEPLWPSTWAGEFGVEGVC